LTKHSSLVVTWQSVRQNDYDSKQQKEKWIDGIRQQKFDFVMAYNTQAKITKPIYKEFPPGINFHNMNKCN
jgi:hypothetical protein